MSEGFIYIKGESMYMYYNFHHLNWLYLQFYCQNLITGLKNKQMIIMKAIQKEKQVWFNK